MDTIEWCDINKRQFLSVAQEVRHCMHLTVTKVLSFCFSRRDCEQHNGTTKISSTHANNRRKFIFIEMCQCHASGDVFSSDGSRLFLPPQLNDPKTKWNGHRFAVAIIFNQIRIARCFVHVKRFSVIAGNDNWCTEREASSRTVWTIFWLNASIRNKTNRKLERKMESMG